MTTKRGLSLAQPRSRFSRRGLLRSLGVSTALLPFVPLLERETQAADGEAAPKRLVLLFTPNGTLAEQWLGTVTDATTFELGPILAPLEEHHQNGRLTVVTGLDMVLTGPGDNHQVGMASLWTGSETTGGNFANGAGWASHQSVDQFIASQLPQDAHFKSLQFGVQTGNSADIWSRMIYSGANTPETPEDSPQAMFDTLVSNIATSDSTELDRLRAERKSSIDLVKNDLARLSSRLGHADQTKLEAHLNAVREIERRNDLPGVTCEVPTMDFSINDGANASFPTVSEQMVDQLVMALSCDLTRIASLQWSKSVSSVQFDWVGVNRSHHELSHEADTQASMVESITAINNWYASQIARLLDGLAAIPEGDGTMLDNTIVVWGNELGRGNNHSRRDVPFLIAGGGGGALQSGRTINSEDIHNRLLVSLCQAMGLNDVQTFGSNDTGSGPIPGLLV